MRIDAHQHFWRHDPVRDAWISDEMAVLRRDFLPPELEGVLRAAGVDGCVAVQADTSEDETRFLLDLATRHDVVRGVVGWVDLCAPDVEARLEHLAAYPRLCGIRHIVQAEADDYLTRADIARGIAAVGGAGLAYDILVYARQLPAVRSLVERLPDEQRLVVDHIAKPDIAAGRVEPWARHMRGLAEHANVWCKVSGLVTEADWAGWRPEDLRPYLDVVFEAFGPGRLLFGSDWPVCLLAAEYADVVGVVEDYAAHLGEDERAALFGGNARRCYRLDD
jgi:L-fuconolactonase